MRATCATLLTMGMLALASGCGSSSSTTSASGAATTSTVATSTVPAPPAGASGGAGASPKLDKTPRYASPTAAAPVQSGVVNVAYRNITIQPDTLKVKVGSTIKWTNYDPVEHNVTSQGGVQKFASKDFGEGGTFEIKAQKPGVIHYLCTIHPASMNGTIEIVK
jgi:plastocyanin